jgi:hypothetical protein
MKKSPRCVNLIAAASAHISLADVIDGDWCRGDGKRMKIRGPEIVTPGGNRVDGWSVIRAIGYNPTIRLDLVPVGVMPLTGCLLGAVPPSLITSLSRHARAVS